MSSGDFDTSIQDWEYGQEAMFGLIYNMARREKYLDDVLGIRLCGHRIMGGDSKSRTPLPVITDTPARAISSHIQLQRAQVLPRNRWGRPNNTSLQPSVNSDNHQGF